MKTGIFTDSSEEYHNQAHIGSTSLKQMAVTPAHFLQAWKGPKKESKAFDEGHAVHSVLLEQSTEAFVRRPDGIDGRTKEGKAQLEALKESGKIVLDGGVFDSLEERLNTFVKSTEAMKCYDHAEIEKSFYAQDPVTGLFIKARPDIYKPGVIVDLKTTANVRYFDKDLFKFGYHIQAGFYAMVTEIVTGVKIREFKFIVQEKAAPYGIKVFKLNHNDLAFCKEKARELLNRVSVCMKEDKFPAYDDIETEIQIPMWIYQDGLSFEEAI